MFGDVKVSREWRRRSRGPDAGSWYTRGGGHGLWVEAKFDLETDGDPTASERKLGGGGGGGFGRSYNNNTFGGWWVGGRKGGSFIN